MKFPTNLYKRLEYLESSGTQYIDTGINVGSTSNFNLDLDFASLSKPDTTDAKLVFICSNVWTFNVYCLLYRNSTSDWKFNGDNNTVATFTADTRYRYTTDYSANTGTLSLTDGTEYTHTLGTNTNLTNLKLFGNEVADKRINIRVYSLKCYSGTTLIGHFIPAQRISDDVIGMYDTVSGTFFTNSGTGTFIAGPQVDSIVISNNGTPAYPHELYVSNVRVPSGYTQLEYLQNAIGGYVNTGIIPSFTDTFEIKCKKAQNYSIFGSGSSGYTFTGSAVQIMRIGGRSNNFEADLADSLHTVTYDGTSIFIDGNIAVQTVTKESTSPTFTMYMYCRNYNNTPSDGTGNQQIAYFKLSDENGVQKLYYIAAKRNSDNALGFYDLVTNTFIVGTGTFTAGPEITPEVSYVNEAYANVDGTITKVFDAGYDTSISGTNNLLLPDARAKQIDYIVEGNSTLGGLPEGYTRLDYIQNTNGAYINTGLQVTNNTYDVTFELANISNQSIFGTREPGWRMWLLVYSNVYEVGLVSDNIVTSSVWLPTVGVKENHTLQIVDDGSNYLWTAYHNGVVLQSYVSQSVTKSGQPTAPITLFTTNGNGSAYRANNLKIYDWKVTSESGELIQHLIPAKNSSNVVGMYDTVTSTFFTNAGTGSFTAGNTLPIPSSPLEIEGAGKSTIYPNQLFNIANRSTATSIWGATMTPENGKIHLTGTGTLTDYANDSGLVPWLNGNEFVAGRKYYMDMKGLEGFTSTDTPISFRYDGANRAFWTEPVIFTRGSAGTRTFSWNVVKDMVYDYVFEPQIIDLTAMYGEGNEPSTIDEFKEKLGMSEIPVLPYTAVSSVKYIANIKTTNRSAVTADNYITLNTPLNKITTYKDRLISDGIVYRNVGVKVLDGTESWEIHASIENWFKCDRIIPNVLSGTITAICSHFIQSQDAASLTNGQFVCQQNTGYTEGRLVFRQTDCTTVEEFKAWLAEQYAAGTPVTVLYPLASMTEESVSCPSITLSEGNNSVEVIGGAKPSTTEIVYRRKRKYSIINIYESGVGNDNNCTYKVNGGTSKNLITGNHVVIDQMDGVKQLEFYASYLGRDTTIRMRPTGGSTWTYFSKYTPLAVTCDIDLDFSFGSCLLYGTQILMADGTTKPIENVCIGNSIMDYEGKAQTVTNAKLGTSPDYDKWIFSDGSVLKTCVRHRAYNIEKQAMVYMEEWAIGEHGYNANHEVVELISHEHVEGMVNRSTIFTDTNNYFADGILCGNRKSVPISLP